MAPPDVSATTSTLWRATRQRAVLVWTLLVVLFLIACLARMTASGSGTFRWTDDQLILSLRASRLLAAIAVGGGLGVAGIILQTLLRNPMASPDVVGVSSGASLGVMLNLYLSQQGWATLGFFGSAAWQLVPAAAGAGVVLALLVATAGWTIRGAKGGGAGGADLVTLLLTGVVINILCGAGVMFLQHLMRDGGFGATRLLMGTLNDDLSLQWMAVAAGGIVAAVLVGALLFGRTLDALALTHDEAVSVGVDVARARLVALVATGLLCTVAVVIAGPLGFVGLVAPHAVRIALGPAASSHRALLPCSAIAGATLILLADTMVRLTNLGSGRMPLGVLTALVGGPMLIFLLRKDARGRA